MIGLFIIAAAATLVLARSFFMPVILAFLLSLVFSPIRRFLARKGVPPGITAAVVVIGLLVALVVGLLSLSAPVREYAQDAPTIIRDVERKMRVLSSAVETVTEASEEVEKLTEGGGGGGEQPERVVVDRPGVLAQVATSAPYMLAQTALTLVLLFFLISSGDMFYEKIVHAIPRFSDKRRAIEIAYDIEKKISRYFLTISVINAGLGVAIGTALYFLGMPNPVLFGVLAFALNFVPYLGALTGVALTAVIGIVTFDTLAQAAFVAFVYFAFTSLEGQFITPYAVGRSLKLNPVVVFIAVAFWGWAWSVIGMVIAVPVLITLRAFSERIPQMNGLGLFLAGRHVEVQHDEDDRGSSRAA
ncbi:AI-2E family transporter [Roseitranquillus sediminis]|uniref:AI-2E family transporter n=1 Tax=Roseitranquillus sediminis TaxID=2809051 RepID=UPI001D0C54BA|nr:AI-2E family transporter [Roseitranquillus sediminis]MBM9592999.1 AI-2E family transporter [Roseitranquillus sediminis]